MGDGVGVEAGLVLGGSEAGGEGGAMVRPDTLPHHHCEEGSRIEVIGL